MQCQRNARESIRNDNLFKNESADLLFHLLVLFAEKNISLNDVIDVLKKRHQVK